MSRIIFKLPILLVIVFTLLMYLIGETDIAFKYSFPYQAIVSLVIFILGTVIIVIGGYSFKKANTTVNPVSPEKATQLVKTGIYNYSRNPMYIGFLAWLVAFSLFIGTPINLLLLPLYIFLVNRLYIAPEEKALENLFENEFREYKERVRRWI